LRFFLSIDVAGVLLMSRSVLSLRLSLFSRLMLPLAFLSTVVGSIARAGKIAGCVGMVACSFVLLPPGSCLANDQDQDCAEALASTSQLIKARFGPVLEAVDLDSIKNWRNTPYHPGSEQLTFLLKSQLKGGVEGMTPSGLARSPDSLMANQNLQAELARRIVQACPLIDLVSFQLVPDSRDWQAKGSALTWGREQLSQAPIASDLGDLSSQE